MQISNVQQFSQYLKKYPVNHGIQKGDLVYGRIIGFSSGKILGIFNGVPLFAESRVPVKAGQKIFAKVTDIVDGKLHISLMDPSDAEKSKSEGLKNLLATLGLKEDPASLLIVRKMISQKLPLKNDIFQDALSIFQKSADPMFAVSLFLRLYSRLNGRIPAELMSILQGIDMKKFRRLFSGQKDLPVLKASALKDILAGKQALSPKALTRNENEYLQKLKLVTDFAYEMNSGFFRMEDESSCCWLKEFVKYDKNLDVTAYNLGIEVDVKGLAYFDILMTHISSPGEKNLTVQFFDLENMLMDLIRETSENYFAHTLKLDYDNIYLNFSTEGSFSCFEPESVEIPSIAGSLNIKA